MKVLTITLMTISLLPKPVGYMPEKKATVEIQDLGMMTVTSYRSVPQQTDRTPHHTSIGYRTSELGVAVSQDQLCKVSKWCRRNVSLCDKTKIHYGDILVIEKVGPKIVFDCMHERHKRRLDVWVPTYQDEKRFGTRRLQAYLVEVRK